MEKLKQKRIMLFALIGVLFLTVVGTTYAYFNLTTSGNDSASGITVYDAKLHLTYDGGERITGTTVEPSNTTPIGTKTIEITNDGTESVYYLLHWKELYNELVRQDSDSEDELYITATCISYTNYGETTQAVSGTCEGFTKDIPTQSTLYTYSSGEISDTYIIKENISIASGVTHVYSVSIYFRNESYSQNYNQNKQFYGSVGVAESEEGVILPTAKSSLSEYTWAEIKQLSDALVAGKITSSQLSTTYNISVGSEKSAKIKGTYRTFRLVGLLHDVGASDNTLGMTFEQTTLMDDVYSMKSSMTSSDSWDNSDLKTTVNNFTLPDDLNSVITSAKKPCVTSVSNSTLTYVTSKLWIMSETEIAGTKNYTKGKTAEGTQYAYYQTNNNSTSRTKKLGLGSSNNYYWLRSAFNWYEGDGYSYFAAVSSSGSLDSLSSSSYVAGFSLCFCI